jgi:Methyltransferase domain
MVRCGRYRGGVLPHWDEVIEPFLTALDAGPIVEIGSAAGDTTERLAKLAAEGGLVLHAIDPAPQFDPAELEGRFEGDVRFHREGSHAALERIGPAAAVLIDGDHNWYAVHGELTRLEEASAAAGRPFPLVFLHDVEWPYARRDMYYDPERIPEGWRQPWARRGIRWGETALDEDGGGINPHLANALTEGGPCNGVLTAIEDFVEGSATALELRIVNGEAGLGVLVSRELLDAAPAVRQEWERLYSPQFLLQRAAELSRAAARETAARIEAGRAAGERLA